jgi:peptidoglycan/xylan/chitin deacetylase (PgdA/CDA1 family)
VTGLVRKIGTAFLRSASVKTALLALARVRGHRLVLVYHRLGESLRPDCAIVPSVPADMFRDHLQALGDVVELVSLDTLADDNWYASAGEHRRRPAVAVTFDDDLPSHVEHALPALREFGVPAAFFLSGRSLHGLGAYWFQHLETLLTTYGAPRTASLLGVPDAGAEGLMKACEGSADLRRRVSERAADLPMPNILQPEAIAALAAAGMTIGFHTVDHDVLPPLDQPALQQAVSRGREDVAAITGTPVTYFAYPHGKADTRSEAAVRAAGFRAAFTGVPAPIRAGDDRHRLGRWEPGPLGVDELLIKLTSRFHGANLRRRIGSR